MAGLTYRFTFIDVNEAKRDGHAASWLQHNAQALEAEVAKSPYLQGFSCFLN